MGHRSAGAKPDLAKRQRERHGQKREHHQHPEDVDIGEVRRLRLHLLADPGKSLFPCFGERTPMGDEKLGRPLQRVLILALDGMTCSASRL